MGFSKNRDPAFLHGFEQGGLGFRRRAVDFVGKHDIGEQRTGLEYELTASVNFLENGVSGDIAGKEVRSELDAFVFEMQEFGKSFDEFGFTETGKAFQKDVAACENPGDYQTDDFFLTE